MLGSRSGSMKRRKCADSPTSVPGSETSPQAMSKTGNTKNRSVEPPAASAFRGTVLCKQQTVERQETAVQAWRCVPRSSRRRATPISPKAGALADGDSGAAGAGTSGVASRARGRSVGQGI